MEIRSFQAEDAKETSAVIIKTLRISNSKDYSEESIQMNMGLNTPEELQKKAKEGHMYVVCDGSRIIGCGAIVPYEGRKSESLIVTVFVLPEYQGKGIGKQIIETLEQDPLFVRASRVEVHASITGVEFYKKLGYGYSKVSRELEEGEFYRLEKVRCV